MILSIVGGLDPMARANCDTKPPPQGHNIRAITNASHDTKSAIQGDNFRAMIRAM